MNNNTSKYVNMREKEDTKINGNKLPSATKPSSNGYVVLH